MAKTKVDQTEPLKRGPKPRAGETSTQFSFRITDDERERWKAAATAAGKTLSEWLRAAAEAAIPKRKKS
jgi:predicted HicB family RNase H-like nuclease